MTIDPAYDGRPFVRSPSKVASDIMMALGASGGGKRDLIQAELVKWAREHHWRDWQVEPFADGSSLCCKGHHDG